MYSPGIEDDFVMTLSDNDLMLGSNEESDSEDEALTTSKKRKHEDAKSSAQRKRTRTKQQVDLADDSSTDEISGGDLPTHPDFDANFEFDLGVIAVNSTVQSYEGWGPSSQDFTGLNKKSVDLDKIIARRKAKEGSADGSPQLVNERGRLESSEGEDTTNGSMEGDESDEDQEPGLVFRDDELIADDTFGGLTNLEDLEMSDNPEDNGESGSQSDDDSVATPTTHPDDLDSQSDDETSSQTSQSSTASKEREKRAAFFAAEEQPLSTPNNDKSTSTSFLRFSLSRPLLRALTTMSYSEPTPIQIRAIPIALQGLDIVGSAQTGSGKTAAFLLPILERLLYKPSKIPITRVVILLPTRELAVQCYNVALSLARYTDITFAQIVGGFSLRDQETVLKKRPDIVIATPGRFIDHMRNSATFQMEKIEILVLDEADRMLEDGFADELDEILKTIPRRRQTMLFSATMTESVDKLVRVGMDKPVRVSVDAKRSTVEGLTQEFVRLRPGREHLRLATLCVLCKTIFTRRAIVFFRQKKEAHRVRIVFGLLGIKAGELHGSMSQEQRIAAVNAFRDGETTHLLATDLASRGLDIKNVMSVINYEAPQSHEIYLHRVGRTARAGRSGSACTIAAETDRKVVKAAVKAGRSQGAKIISRVMEQEEVESMNDKVEAYDKDIDEILEEEKEEKALAQAETQITRGQNLVKHEAEIMSRPKRTWFETEKEKAAAREKGLVELNGVKVTGVKKKMSNKQKKRMDLKRERVEGHTFKKTKDSEMRVKKGRAAQKSSKIDRAAKKLRR